MSTSTSTQPPSHCGWCGLPLFARPRCGACGQPAGRPSIPAPSPTAATIDAEQADTLPSLIDTLNHFRSKNYGYYVPMMLNKLGPVGLPVDQPEGKFWNLVWDRPERRQVFMLVGFDVERQTLILEMPLVHLNAADNAAIERTALELNETFAGGMRIALRPPSLLLRSLTPIATLPPMRMLALLAGFADLSRDLEIFFTTRFGYRTANPQTNATGAGAGRVIAARVPPFTLSLEPGGGA